MEYLRGNAFLRQQPIAQSAPLGFGEAFTTAFPAALLTHSVMGEVNATNAVLQPRIDALNEAGFDIPSRMGSYLKHTGAAAAVWDPFTHLNFQRPFTAMNEALARAKERDPEFPFEPLTLEQLHEQIAAHVQQSERDLSEAEERALGAAGNFGLAAAHMATFGHDLLQNPMLAPLALMVGPGATAINFARLAVMGKAQFTAREISRRALVEGLVGAGFEVWWQPGVAAWRLENGFDYDAHDFARAVGAGFAGGAVIGGVVQGARLGVGMRRAGDAVLDDLADASTTDAIHAAIDRLDVDAIMNGVRAVDLAGGNVPSEGLYASRMFFSGKEIYTGNPLVGPGALDEHVARLMAAERNLTHADMPPPSLAPNAAVRPIEDVHHYDRADPFTKEFHLSALLRDNAALAAQRAAPGVEVPEWRARQSGHVLVFERADGQQEIIDGHKRIALAADNVAAGREAPVFGAVLKEIDGITPEQAREVARIRNTELKDAPERIRRALAPKQASLFDGLEVERAQVIEALTVALGRDLEPEGRAANNILDKDVTAYERAIKNIPAHAHREGEIGQAISEAASIYKKGGSQADAIRALASVVRPAIRRGVFDSLEPDTAGGVIDDAAPAGRVERELETAAYERTDLQIDEEVATLRMRYGYDDVNAEGKVIVPDAHLDSDEVPIMTRGEIAAEFDKQDAAIARLEGCVVA